MNAYKFIYRGSCDCALVFQFTRLDTHHERNDANESSRVESGRIGSVWSGALAFAIALAVALALALAGSVGSDCDSGPCAFGWSPVCDSWDICLSSQSGWLPALAVVFLFSLLLLAVAGGLLVRQFASLSVCHIVSGLGGDEGPGIGGDWMLCWQNQRTNATIRNITKRTKPNRTEQIQSDFCCWYTNMRICLSLYTVELL